MNHTPVIAALLLTASAAQGVVCSKPLPPDPRLIVAEWNGSSCVPIGPYHAITAKHTYGDVGQYVHTSNDSWHQSVSITRGYEGLDITVIRVREPFTQWHPLLRREVQMNERFVMAGYGQTGLPGQTVGFPRRPIFAENRFAGPPVNYLVSVFDVGEDALPHEGYFVINDSGGGALVEENGVFKIAGTVSSATNPFVATPGAANFMQSVNVRQNWIDSAVGCNIDADDSGAVDHTDIFVFIDRWFHGEYGWDANFDGVKSIDDIFTFINLWFETYLG